MKHIRIFAALAIMTVLSSTAVAQIVSPVDFMQNNPRKSFANAAFYTPEYGYFDFFLGGLNFGEQNIGFKYNNFFRCNEIGQPTTLLLDGVSTLRDKNYMNTYGSMDVLNCGRRTAHGFFSFSHRIRYWETASYSKDLVALAMQGNSAFMGESNAANIQLSTAAKAYQEFNVGYQMSLTEKLNIGLRLKLLLGIVDVKSDYINVQLYTDPATYALRLMANAELQATLPYEFTVVNGMLKPVDTRFNLGNLFKNLGGGIDLGAEYKFNDQFGMAVAVNDLGFISWKTYAAKFTAGIQDAGSFYDNGAFVFPGLSQEQVSGILDDPQFMEKLLDSLKGYVSITPESLTKYTSGLNTSLMLRGYYDLTPEHRFSAQLMGFQTGLGMKPAFTLAYSGAFSEKFDVVATYTMMEGSYDNIGVGLSANLGGFLVYVASNNILGFFSPLNMSQVNLQFGIAFTANERVSRSETIILKDKQNSEEQDQEEE